MDEQSFLTGRHPDGTPIDARVITRVEYDDLNRRYRDLNQRYQESVESEIRFEREINEMRAAHDRRVTELLEANNREVERRRMAEGVVAEIRKALDRDPIGFTASIEPLFREKLFRIAEGLNDARSSVIYLFPDAFARRRELRENVEYWEIVDQRKKLIIAAASSEALAWEYAWRNTIWVYGRTGSGEMK
jgi:hypothetical protein